ncbi:hypothetical protein NYP18_07050 [Corynebacterium sp. YIM 101645]|uniref:Lipoprotein n=1 Tax=Corynebacterium lemuris TaxID=1859292 RepID=A0ABT2FVZ4_9CORY|nr:hypothetical protein [Corynebacterium lemuris]MCS5479412.1 hypothetical protein [Corynebacterium lemuris]
MVRRATALLTAGLLLVGCATPTDPTDNAQLVTPSGSTSVTETVTQLEYTEVPAGRFRLPGQDGHAFASSDGVTECRIRVTGSGTSGECVSAATSQEESALIVFDEQQHHNGEFSADIGAAAPGQTAGVPAQRLAPGEMIRLGTVTCLSPAEGSLACLSEETGDGFRLTGHRYDTFHRGGERFGL